MYFEQHQPLIPHSLQQLGAWLDPKVYFRANRQQITNLHWLAGIEPWFSNTLTISLRNGPRERCHAVGQCFLEGDELVGRWHKMTGP